MRIVSLLALAAACGDQTQAQTPDTAPVVKCTATPTQLVTGDQLAPPGNDPVGIQNPNIRVDADHLYFSLAYTGTNGHPDPTGHIMRVPLGGGALETVADSPHPSYFMIVGDTVVFGDDVNGILSAPTAGGSPTAFAAANGKPGWLAHDDGFVFFIDDHGIERAPLLGGETSHVTDRLAFSFAVLGSNLVLADFSGNEVASMPAGGGALTSLATNQDAPLYPVACGSSVCWINAGTLQDLTGSIVGIAAGAATPRASGQVLFRPHGFVADATSFYTIAEGDNSAVTRVPLAGGTIDVLAQNHGAGDITADDDCIYWSAFDGIYSLRKDAAPL
jgi:hypothetical protein